MRRLIAVAALAITVSTIGVAQESDGGYTERGPRFLVAMSPAPVRVDVMKTPMLRRRISIDLRGVSLLEALRIVSERSGVHLAFSNTMLPERTVDLRADNITVAAALTELLLDARVDILFSRDGRGVLVRRQAEAGPTGAIVGRVKDAKTGAGLASVELLLKDSRWRAVTDTSGRYRLVEVDTGTYSMIVRRVGYAKETRRVTVRAEREDTVDLVLEPAAAKLEDLVTTATGQQRRRDIGNAITTIKADSVLRTAPIRNLTDLLANRVPGLSVQHTSGAPGDPARLRLRGISSVMRGNDPVVVVDGIRVYASQSEARSGNLTNLARRSSADDSTRFGRGNLPAPSPLDQIDPNIIEKIEVFKGPSAATLYGADAANGVIVITTKKGKPGPTRWNASVAFGRTIPAGHYPVGYYRWGHAIADGGVQEFCPLIYVRCMQDSLVQYQALNDPDMSIFGRGRRTSLSLTASGGSQALTYSITGTYGDETGLLKLPDFEVERFRSNFNREPPDWMRRPHHLNIWSVTSNVTALIGRTADVTLSTTMSRSEQKRTSLENQQASLAGTYVDKVNGVYYRPERAGAGAGVGGNVYVINPTSDALRDYYQRATAGSLKFTTGLTTTWRPWPWFTGSGQAGLDVMPRDDESLLPTGLPGAADSGALVRGTGRSLVSTLDVRGTLRRPLKWGFVFETSAGTDVTTTSTNDLISSAQGLVPGTSSLAGASRFSATDSRVSTSVFGWYLEPRISGQRIALSTGLRLDGGSTYGARLTRTSGGLFGGLLGLPKLNGSWVISEEPWFPFKSVFSSLRLRGAYGQAQVQPGAADRLRLYARQIGAAGDLLDVDKVGNTELRPERSTEFEGGFDADLLNSRLSVELTAYRKVQVDALMTVDLPVSVSVIGGGSVVQNIGNIRNTGLEVTTRIIPVQSPLLTWSAEVNFNRNANTLTKLGPGVETNPRQGVVAGYPVASRWSRPILGYFDRNGDGVVEGGEVQLGDTLVYMGRLLPAYQTSFFTNLALFHGAVGVTAGFSYDAGATQVDETARTNWVLNRALVDPTAPQSQQAAVVVAHLTDYGVTQTVSTFRFNSLSVNYNAPASVARLVRAQRLSIALQGANLGMHSSYRGKDPDVTAWSPTEHIIDTGQIAIPRTWQLAFNLDF